MTDQDINNMINLQSDNLHQAHSKKDSFYGPFPDDILQKKQKTKKKTKKQNRSKTNKKEQNNSATKSGISDQGSYWLTVTPDHPYHKGQTQFFFFLDDFQ